MQNLDGPKRRVNIPVDDGRFGVGEFEHERRYFLVRTNRNRWALILFALITIVVNVVNDGLVADHNGSYHTLNISND